MKITGFSDLRGRFEETYFADAIAVRVEIEDRLTFELDAKYMAPVHCMTIREFWFGIRSMQYARS